MLNKVALTVILLEYLISLLKEDTNENRKYHGHGIIIINAVLMQYKNGKPVKCRIVVLIDLFLIRNTGLTDVIISLLFTGSLTIINLSAIKYFLLSFTTLCNVSVFNFQYVICNKSHIKWSKMVDNNIYLTTISLFFITTYLCYILFKY